MPGQHHPAACRRAGDRRIRNRLIEGRLIRGRHRCALVLHVDEFRVAAGHAQVDMAVGQLLRHLRSGLAEDVHQAEPEGWLEGCRDSASGVGNRVVAHAGDGL